MEERTPRCPLASSSSVVPPNGIPEHELIRCIGQGSYGDVWLARSVLGSYRAVKVVYRSRFKDPDPYEREYRGVKNFEPVSRTHEGFVDVLQVGRNDQGGYFYYIMELADDESAGPMDPKIYSPKTLSSEKIKWGKYPFDEVLHLSMVLTGALAHLHKKGLVHRDLKPSNIIFIDGHPKLADVGLVAEASEARSFVGTPGYIPVEGSGTAQADIFSLGKVIYEVATGKDRQEYPGLPSDWDQGTEKDKFNELNEIILKACETDTRERYATAENMLNDLALLQAGKSIKRLNLLERRFALLVRYGLVLTVLAGISWGITQLIVRERRREREVRLQQARASVAYGLRLMEEGNLSGALPWFAEGLNMDHEDPQNEKAHRVRIEAVRRQCPKLEQIWKQDGQPRFGRFSPDGKLIAIANLELGVELFDVATGKKLPREIQHGAEKGVRTVSFSPDGKYLVTVGGDHFARLWNLQTGKEVLPGFEHKEGLMSAEFSPDGKQVLTACRDRKAYLWDCATAKLVRTFDAHEDELLYAAFSPDGGKIVSASRDNSAIIWNVKTGKPGPRLWHKSWVYQAVFSPDNQTVVTASYDGVVQIWDVLSGQPAFKPLFHSTAVRNAEFSPDGRYLAVSASDSTARIWDLKTGELANTPLAHGGQLTHCCFSPEGRQLLTLSQDKFIRLWDLEPNSWLPPSVPAIFSASGERYFLISNAEVRVGSDWVGKGKTDVLGLKAQRLIPNRTGAYVLVTSSTNIAPASEVKNLQVWDVVRNRAVGVPFQSESSRNHWWLTSDGLIAISLFQNIIQTWDVLKGQQLYPELQMPSQVNELSLANNDKYFVILCDTKAIVYNTKTGQPVCPPLAHVCSVAHAEFNSKGTRVVTACADNTLEPRYAQIWSLPDGKPIGKPLKHKDGVSYATFSPDDRFVATASEDTTTRLWDANTAQEIGPPLQHPREVNEVQFSPDGRWVVTGCRNGTARVWEVPTGHALTPPLKHPDTIRNVQWIGGGQAILTHMQWYTYFVWDLPPITNRIEEIEMAAEITSGSSPGSARTTRLSESELLAWWEQQKGRASNSNALASVAWHQREAEANGKLDMPFAARFHLNYLISARPLDPELYAQRAGMNAEMELWNDAEQDFKRAEQLGKNDPASLCQQAYVALALGNTNDYRRLCADLNKQAPQVQDQNIRTTLCWTVALLPNALENYATITETAQSAVKQGSYHQQSLQVLGAVLYRTGNWEESIKTLQGNTGVVGEKSVVESWILIAMAHHQLGHKQEALNWIRKAQKWIDEYIPAENRSTGYHLSWQRRQDISLLISEAKALIVN